MKNSKKILSLALTLAMLMSAIFCTGIVADAASYSGTNTMVLMANPVSELDMDMWGENLIPDPNVSQFVEDDGVKTYDSYLKTTNTNYSDSTYNNPSAWWDRASSYGHAYRGFSNGSDYKSPAALGKVVSDTQFSHTQDGSGAIMQNSSSFYLSIPKIKESGTYLLTFWAKTTASSEESLSFQFYTTDSSDNINATASAQTGPKINSTWKQITAVLTIPEDGTINIGILNLYKNSSTPAYYDDFGLYKLNTTLLTTESKKLAHKFDLGAYADFDFSTLGTNLAYDSTISRFNEDGTYDTTNANRAPQGDSGIDKNIYFAPGHETHKSHTNDSSGVMYLPTSNKVYMIHVGPQMQTRSYYLVTFFIKGGSTGNSIRHYTSVASWTKFDIHTTTSEWKRVTYIVYTGTESSNTAIGTNNKSPSYIDDIGVYKLDPEYAQKCITDNKLYTEAELLAETKPTGMTLSAKRLTHTQTEKFNYDAATNNLMVDPNVSYFDENNNYKKYYANNDITLGDLDQTVVDTNAWWNKVANVWQFFTAKNKEYGGPAINGLVKHGVTRTADGSGAIVVPATTHAYLPVSALKKQGYYLITMWVNSQNTRVEWNLLSSGLSSLVGGKQWNEDVTPTWYRMSYIVRTGMDDIGSPVIDLYCDTSVTLDDFSVYELDFEYGAQCFDEGKMIDNNEVAQKAGTEVVTSTTNTAVSLNVADGYFVPYGAVYDGQFDTSKVEKLANGQFFVKEADTYSYKQFKYPAGIVGTFGASAKTDADDTKTGIQFGSLITDNLSIDKDGAQGTLVFRDTDKGTFEEFRATFPTKTRKELAAEIYAKLKAAEEASSIDLANRAVTLNNGGKSVVVMYVPRTTYMWKNSANTELQYAVRVHSIATNYGDVNYTAIGYVTKDGKLEFSNEIKDGVYNELIPAAN